MNAKSWLPRLPILLAMALLLLPWAVTAANGLAKLAGRTQPLIRESPLNGVENTVAKIPTEIGALWSGAFQTAFTARFDRALPLLPAAVEFKNQLYYSVLRQSGVDSVTIGKHLQLYEPVYINEYCNRDTPAILAHADEWASKIEQMQKWYALENKVFVYVITPSKAAVYPQYFSNLHPCPTPTNVREALGVGWDAILDRHGIRYVDAAKITRDAKAHYPFEMFPLGGTHWNEVAAALAAQAIVDRIDIAQTPWKIRSFDFNWRMTQPTGISVDLTRLLNVPYPRMDWQVPEVTVKSTFIAQDCHPLNVAVVGGSFMYEILWTLEKASCPPDISFYSYFFIEQALYPGDRRGPVQSVERDQNLVFRAQIVILEENEAQSVRSHHLPMLFDLLAANHAE